MLIVLLYNFFAGKELIFFFLLDIHCRCIVENVESISIPFFSYKKNPFFMVCYMYTVDVLGPALFPLSLKLHFMAL